MIAASPRLKFDRIRPYVVAALAVFTVLLAFRETAAGMVDIWLRSETFNHALLVPPISLWLIWQRRAAIASQPVAPLGWLVLPLAAIALAWLLGELAAIDVVTHFALIGMVVVVIPMVLGWRAAWDMAFPLGFLFFAVPFGEFVMPKLMDWTAYFTVAGLRASGIPVYQEGLHFVIPSGHWSVVEACSGVRYLIASIVVGTLYAYLTYRSVKRRLIFVAVAIVVPLVANWVRAYMIVLIGHLSGNTLAVGVDHLIYGWVFFGLVIMIMFAIGARWREDSPPVTSPAGAPSAMASPRTPTLLFPLAAVVVVSFGARGIIEARELRDLAGVATESAAVASFGKWSSSTRQLTDWQPRFLNPTSRLNAVVAKDRDEVGITIYLYRHPDRTSKVISSENVLVASNDRSWLRVSRASRRVDSRDRTFDVQVSTLRPTNALTGADHAQLVVWHWYRIGDQSTSNDWLGKLELAKRRLLGQDAASAAIFVYAFEPGADERLAEYLRDDSAISRAIEQAFGRNTSEQANTVP